MDKPSVLHINVYIYIYGCLIILNITITRSSCINCEIKNPRHITLVVSVNTDLQACFSVCVMEMWAMFSNKTIPCVAKRPLQVLIAN